MGRNRALVGTNGYHRFVGPHPFFQQFVNHLVPTEEPTPTAKLFEDYCTFVRKFSTGEESMLKMRKFSIELYKFSLQRPETMRRTTHPRGYYVKLNKVHRDGSLAAGRGHVEYRKVKMTRQCGTAKAKVSSGVLTSNQYMKIIHTGSSTLRYAGFATTNLLRGTPVCEYKGERITGKEAKARVVAYKVEGRPATMVECQDGRKKYWIDGERRDDGTYFGLGENIAAYLNHDLYEPNCKLEWRETDGGRKPFICAAKIICEGNQLTWNYGDIKKDQEDWYTKEGSAYL